MLLNLKRAIRSSLAFAAGVALLCFPSQVLAKTAKRQVTTGVLYSIEGGTGAGMINVYGGGELLRLQYENPRDDRGFREVEDYHLGSIVKVRFHKSGRTLVLDRMTYTGRHNDAVKSADEFVYRHFALLAGRDCQSAYSNLSLSLRSRYSYEDFVRDFGWAKFNNELGRRWVLPSPLNRYAIPTYGTKMIGQTKRRILVLVKTIHFIEGRHEYYRYDLVRDDDSWLIDKIRSLSEEEYEAS
jgi:hypothetical protein